MRRVSSPSRTVRIITLIFALICGIWLLAGGIWLTAAGGSPYYLITGVMMLIVATLLWRRSAYALILYALLLLATLIWSVWEVGFDYWALVPRTDIWVIFAVWLLLPVVRRSTLHQSKPGVILLTLSLIASAAVLIRAVWHDPQEINGTLTTVPATSPVTVNPPIPADDWPAWGRDLAGTLLPFAAD